MRYYNLALSSLLLVKDTTPKEIITCEKPSDATYYNSDGWFADAEGVLFSPDCTPQWFGGQKSKNYGCDYYGDTIWKTAQKPPGSVKDSYKYYLAQVTWPGIGQRYSNVHNCYGTDKFTYDKYHLSNTPGERQEHYELSHVAMERLCNTKHGVLDITLQKYGAFTQYYTALNKTWPEDGESGYFGHYSDGIPEPKAGSEYDIPNKAYYCEWHSGLPVGEVECDEPVEYTDAEFMDPWKNEQKTRNELLCNGPDDGLGGYGYTNGWGLKDGKCLTYTGSKTFYKCHCRIKSKFEDHKTAPMCNGKYDSVDKIKEKLDAGETVKGFGESLTHCYESFDIDCRPQTWLDRQMLNGGGDRNYYRAGETGKMRYGWNGQATYDANAVDFSKYDSRDNTIYGASTSLTCVQKKYVSYVNREYDEEKNYYCEFDWEAHESERCSCRKKTEEDKPRFIDMIDERWEHADHDLRSTKKDPPYAEWSCNSLDEFLKEANIPEWRTDITCEFKFVNGSKKCRCQKMTEQGIGNIPNRLDHGENHIIFPGMTPWTMYPTDLQCQQLIRMWQPRNDDYISYRSGTDHQRGDYTFLCRWNAIIKQCECYNKPNPDMLKSQVESGESPTFFGFNNPLTDRACRYRAGLTDEDMDWDCKVNPLRYRECQCGPMEGFEFKPCQYEQGCGIDGPTTPTVDPSGDCKNLPFTFVGGPRVSDCKAANDCGFENRSDISCFLVNGNKCVCDVDENAPNGGPNVPEECANGNCPITFTGGPDDSDCYTKGHVYAADNTIKCTAKDGECTCEDTGEIVNPPTEEELNIPFECDSGNCPYTYIGGPRVIDCRRAGKVNDKRGDITCVVIGDSCKCDFAINFGTDGVPDVKDQYSKGNCPITFPGGETPEECEKSAGIENSTDLSCEVKLGNCVCGQARDILQECDNGNSPAKFTGGSNSLECRNNAPRFIGQGIPAHREDIVCEYLSASSECQCSLDLSTGPDVKDQCANGNCPIVFPGGPNVESCYNKGHIPESDRGSKIVCVVVRNECSCDNAGGDNGGGNHQFTGPNVIDACAKSNCPIKFIGGPTVQDCLREGQIPENNDDYTCTIRLDKCICDKKIIIVEEIDAGRGPITYPGGPNHIDCRKQAKVPFNRLDITCWFMEEEKRCQCAKDIEDPNVVKECANGNCPISYPGGPTEEDCMKQGSITAADNIKCEVKGDFCHCDELEMPTIEEQIDNGEGPIIFEGGPSHFECRQQSKVSNSRMDISCESLGNGKCKCGFEEETNQPVVETTQAPVPEEPTPVPVIETTQAPVVTTAFQGPPKVVDICDAGNCPITFPGTNKMKARGCKKFGSVPNSRKDITCTIKNTMCTCKCPTCGVTIPVVADECDAGNCPVSFPGGPRAKACRKQGQIPKDRNDIKCVAKNNMCTCTCPTC